MACLETIGIEEYYFKNDGDTNGTYYTSCNMGNTPQAALPFLATQKISILLFPFSPQFHPTKLQRDSQITPRILQRWYTKRVLEMDQQKVESWSFIKMVKCQVVLDYALHHHPAKSEGENNVTRAMISSKILSQDFHKFSKETLYQDRKRNKLATPKIGVFAPKTCTIK